MTNQSYQRVGRGTIRVQLVSDNLYDCNYIMFRNSAYGNKWFYAFMSAPEHVNNITSQVSYTIDVIQTWFFDYELGQSFIEREHAEVDIAGTNLVPENVELGEYINGKVRTTGITQPNTIVMGSTTYKEGEEWEVNNGGLINKVYSGLKYYVYGANSDGVLAVNRSIEERDRLGKSDSIVTIFMMAGRFIDRNTGTISFDDSASEAVPPEAKWDYIYQYTYDNTKVGDYIPRNRKLLTYPYRMLYVSNTQGNTAIYHYEYMPNITNPDTGARYIPFYMFGDMSANPSIALIPQGYKVPDAGEKNMDEMLVLKGYPQCSWSSDVYAAWLAQNSASLFVNAATGVGTGLVRAAIGNPALGAVSAVNSVASTIATIADHSVRPPQNNGQNAGYLQANAQLLDFHFWDKHITPEFAAIIDDYFDMYGYAVHRHKVPNRHVRENWTYTKTIGCVIHGSCPSDDQTEICRIFDKGITFWSNGNNVGNYSLSNRPLSEVIT